MATAVALPAPVLPFGPPQEELKPIAVVTTEHSLLEIDREMDVLFDHIQDELEENGEPSQKSKERFQQLCDVFGDKVDRMHEASHEPTYLHVFSPSNPAEAEQAYRGFARFLAINLELFTLVEALNHA